MASGLPTNPQETLPICSQGMWPLSVAKCFMAYMALLCMLSHQILVTIQRQAILLRFPFYSLNFNFSLGKLGIIVTLVPKYSLDQHTPPPPCHCLYHHQLWLRCYLFSPLPLSEKMQSHLVSCLRPSTASHHFRLAAKPLTWSTKPCVTWPSHLLSSGPSSLSLPALPHPLLSSKKPSPLPASRFWHVLCPPTRSAPSCSCTRL